MFQTASQTAYFYNFHVADLGNFTVVGPSGSGKTVWLSFIAAQAQRLTPRPKLVFVDKDRGAEIFIRALGGQYEALEPGTATGFNPLMLPDGGETREFLYRLFSFLLRPKGGLDTDLSATEEQVIRNAIKTVVSGPPEGRNLPAFQSLLRGRIQASESDLASRLEPWIRKDQNGWLFNNAEDRFSLNAIFGFDMTRVLDNPTIRTAALLYIFHRIEELIDGTPIMIFLDEGWRLLDDEVFSYFIKDKLKTLRKQNGIIGFGTQSAADIVRSKAANTLIEQTATNVFFANAKADDESYRKAFQLSDREMRWIRETVPEARSFLIKHGQDSVIAKLDLGGMPEVIKVLSGRTETVAELYSLNGAGRERARSLAADFHGEDGLKRIHPRVGFSSRLSDRRPRRYSGRGRRAAHAKDSDLGADDHPGPGAAKAARRAEGDRLRDPHRPEGARYRTTPRRRIRPPAPPPSRATIRKCRRRQPLMRLARRWRRKISVQPQGTSSPAIWRRRRRSSATGRPIKTPPVLIGGSSTIMAGYDQNSSGGTQNGLSWNQVLATANLLVSAYNAINMMRVSQVSQAARGMNFTSFASGSGLLPGNATCGAGYRGGGTANSPCILASSQFCQSLLDGGCVERRATDALGNVTVYLERAQSQ